MALVDSGSRTEFESGAVRDTCVGKGRMDLIDIGFAAKLLGNDPVVNYVAAFVETKDEYYLEAATRSFIKNYYEGIPAALLDVSKQFEEGALKYDKNNWRRGISLHCYVDSALRHYMKFLRGDKDEPHDRATLWNLMCARWTLLHRPACDDIDESYRAGAIVS